MVSVYLSPLGADHRNSDRVSFTTHHVFEHPVLRLDSGASDGFLHSSQLRGQLGDQEAKALGGPLISGVVPGRLLAPGSNLKKRKQ